MQFRVGIGYDIHRLSEGRKLMLGGVEIPYAKGLLGHSDADVLLHAISDALLGAAAKKDIGEHFPNTDEKYRNIASIKLLKEVCNLLKKDNYEIGNIDSTVIADGPILAPFKQQMLATIAKGVGVDEACVNVKATTQEGLGPIGKSEAIAAYAVALLIKK